MASCHWAARITNRPIPAPLARSNAGSAIVHVREPRLAGLETEDGYEQRHVAPTGALAEPWRRIGPLTADGADRHRRSRGPDRDACRRGPCRRDPGHRNPWNATPRAPARHAPSAACKAARDRARSNRACGSSACGSAAVTTGASRPRMSAGNGPRLPWGTEDGGLPQPRFSPCHGKPHGVALMAWRRGS